MDKINQRKKELHLKWENPKKDKIYYEDRDTIEIYTLAILETLLQDYDKELEEKDKEKFFLFLDKLLDNYTEKEYKKEE